MAQSSVLNVCSAGAVALLGCGAPAASTASASPRAALVAAPREDKGSVPLKRFLDDRVQQELKAFKLQGDAWPPGYTADASISKLDRTDHASHDKVSCTVLLTVLDATSSPVAIVRGNASAQGAIGDPSLAREAPGGAARGAVAQLPSVFQQLGESQR